MAYDQLTEMCNDLVSEQRELRRQLEAQQHTIQRLESETDLHAAAGPAAGGHTHWAHTLGTRIGHTRIGHTRPAIIHDTLSP